MKLREKRMRLNKKQRRLLENTRDEAVEFIENRSQYMFKEDIEHELRLIGQFNIIEKNAGYPESLKLMWYWREMAGGLLAEIDDDV